MRITFKAKIWTQNFFNFFIFNGQNLISKWNKKNLQNLHKQSNNLFYKQIIKAVAVIEKTIFTMLRSNLQR